MKRLRCGHGWRGSNGFALAGADQHFPPDLELEPRHLDIALHLDIARRTAVATVTLRIQARRSGVRKLVLQAIDFADLQVTGAEPLSWRYDGNQIDLLWNDPVARDHYREVTLSYRVQDPVSGLHFAGPDDQYPDRASWAATDHETERARYWLPCVDHPAARSTLAFHITADSQHTILANGLLESEAVHDGVKTSHWRLDFPCPSYLICFAVGDFVRADDRAVGDRPIAYFAASGRASAEDLMRSFGRTPKMMEWMERRLNRAFPFSKYYQFALPGFGGAMENISLVSWTDRLVVDETLAKEWGREVDLVNVHEMAHSYFGDAVVIRDFAHAWLKESWATYMEACWLEAECGDDDLRHELYRMSRAYFDEVDERYARPIVTRVYDSSWSMFDAHLYPGGALRLHMLRRELGDGIFWPAVSDYLATYDRQVVETGDFQRKLEQHSGRSLEQFFGQWLCRPGFPDLEVELSFDDEEKVATLRVTQSSKDASVGTPTEDVFKFPLTVAWEEADGTWRRQTIQIERQRQSFVLPMAAMPQQVRLDPDDALVHRAKFNPGDAQLRRALTHGPDFTARVRAAEQLARTGRARNLRSIADAYSNEPFWGVREGFVNALADHPTGATAGIIAELMTNQAHPIVLHRIATVAGRFRDARIEQALVTLLDSQPPYRVTAAALRSLGMQGGERHLARLKAAADDPGYRAIVRNGALLGLAETRSETAFAWLLERVGYGRDSDDASPTAAEALALSAAQQPKRLRVQAMERLAAQATDPRERVRQFVAMALGQLGEEAGASVVDSMQAGFAVQYRPQLRRIVRRLRSGDGDHSPMTRLARRCEALEEEHRKLVERFDDLAQRSRIAER